LPSRARQTCDLVVFLFSEPLLSYGRFCTP
jgi:hypothetical protein